MPDEQPVPAEVQQPKSAVQEVQPSNFYWLLIISGCLCLVMGWFLPWFLGFGGIGYAPMDVIVSSPQGPVEICVYLMAICMAGIIGISLWDKFRSHLSRRLDLIRTVMCVAGLIATVVAWSSASLFGLASDFGNVTHQVTNSAVWLSMFGYTTLSFVFLGRSLVFRKPNIAFGLAFGLFFLLLPLMFHQAVDFVFWAAADLAVYTLLTLGLNVVVGFAGLLDLGYAAFFAIGAYTCASLASPTHHYHFPFWIIIFLGASVASLFGAILGAPTLRLRGDYLAIVTLGFGEIIPDLATNNFFGLTGGPNGISNIDKAGLAGFPFGGIFGTPQISNNGFLGNFNDQQFYWALLFMVAISIIALRNLERSRIGRAWVALREDEVAAAATGINTTSTKLLAFAIGASVSGFAGAFYGAKISIVSPQDFGFTVSVTVLSAVVLGGLGNIAGALIGAATLSFIIFYALPNMQEWMTTFGSHTGAAFLGNIHYTDYTYVVYGVALIGTMLLRPGGLLPSQARKVEFAVGTSGEAVSDVSGAT